MLRYNILEKKSLFDSVLSVVAVISGCVLTDNTLLFLNVYELKYYHLNVKQPLNVKRLNYSKAQQFRDEASAGKPPQKRFILLLT